MIRSMTAFARAELNADWGTAAWELRSVNNRYLDVFLRLPDELKSVDPAVRERIRNRLQRGKVDAALRVSFGAGVSRGIGIDQDVARGLVDAATQMRELIAETAPTHAISPLNPLEVLRWPGVIRGPELDMERLTEQVLALLEGTLDEFIETREREGQKLAAMIAARCDEVEQYVNDIRTRLPEVIRSVHERLRTRVAELVQDLDPQRLEQEVALLVQKTDVAEELDRLGAHVQEVRRVITDRKPAGRRLDFLMQELNREANTLASKSADTTTTRASVELKVAIEQMREQIQNIE
ncbi:MAG: YicC/YloC family endoribonuclease [Gammaproteobacteria bacterium]